MKGKKLLALALALLLLAGCGAKSEDSSMAFDSPASMEIYEENGTSLITSVADASGSTVQSTTEQKLIKRVTISAETEDLEALLTDLSAKIAELGGYIESQELYNGSSYSSYRSRSAYLTIRIPAEVLDGFVAQVYGVSNVVSYNATQEDVTLTYVDTESRMNALKTEEERLLELLSQAENMSDLLEIEERLTEVRYELESVTSQLRVLENQVSYATVTLDIDQVRVYTEVEPQTVWQRIASGFSENLRDIGEGLVDFFVWAVTYSPQLLLLALAAVLVIWFLRRKRQRRKNKVQEDLPKEKDQ